MATKINGDRLLACYAYEGDDVVIQWFKGDTIRFPANVFFANPKTR